MRERVEVDEIGSNQNRIFCYCREPCPTATSLIQSEKWGRCDGKLLFNLPNLFSHPMPWGKSMSVEKERKNSGNVFIM